MSNYESDMALALEVLAQEIVTTIPARSRPLELQCAISEAFNILGLFATKERESKS